MGIAKGQEEPLTEVVYAPGNSTQWRVLVQLIFRYSLYKRKRSCGLILEGVR